MPAQHNAIPRARTVPNMHGTFLEIIHVRHTSGDTARRSRTPPGDSFGHDRDPRAELEAARARSADITPTICYLAELPVPKDCEGGIIYQALEDPNRHLTELAQLRKSFRRLRRAYEGIQAETHRYRKQMAARASAQSGQESRLSQRSQSRRDHPGE